MNIPLAQFAFCRDTTLLHQTTFVEVSTIRTSKQGVFKNIYIFYLHFIKGKKISKYSQ